jgi:steroid 5-alpha reductase family enzyme
VQIVQVQPGPSFGILLVIGAIIWLTGFFFEALGDEQLRRFLSDPENRGKVMDRGLWRYTRHPNYFGESLIWWGLFIIALPVSGGWITIIGPLAITFLLLRVSGVTLLEKDLEERRPEYRDYVRRTSPFIPLPPRKE